MSKKIFICLDDGCINNGDCQKYYKNYVYISGQRQYGYLRKTESCPLFIEDKEREEEEDEKNILSEYRSNSNSSNNRCSINSLRKEKTECTSCGAGD